MKNSWCIVSSVLLVTLLSTAVTVAADSSHTSRQEEVARKGKDVMPFDLGRTTHFFEDTATGGIETVVADSGDDVEQIALIRTHLANEAKRFARGDFSDPATIHGTEMPGLSALAAAGRKFSVSYRSISNGASIRYSSRDKKVVAAIHQWFAAQRSDHGAHSHMHQ